tara:strand:- start:281 stop:1132 length:852 start_codon:yes stop_codon:yes gene_type:complete
MASIVEGTKMNLPSKLEAPFFAYGLFKPGQLCFFRIKNLVKQVSDSEVEGLLKERDGIPLLIKGGHSTIKGVLIAFIDGCEKEAYERIIEIEPHEVYRWEEVTVSNNVEANVLVGRKELRGSTDLEHFTEWSGKTDPFFTDAIDMIEDMLKNNMELGQDHKPLLRLQMAYSLLWSAIERYAGLRYYLGKKVNEKVMHISQEEKFAQSLKKHVKEKREVHDTVDLSKYTLDRNDAKKSLKYYYQVRHNVVHRGKAVHPDFHIMKSSLNELVKIFKDLLDDAWDT